MVLQKNSKSDFRFQTGLAYAQVFSSPWAESKDLEERHAHLTKEMSSWPVNPKDPAKHVDKVQVIIKESAHEIFSSASFLLEKGLLFLWGSAIPFPLGFFLQTGRNTTTITRHHFHHFPTFSLERLSISLKSNLALHSLLTLY
jgi:hypothetical protein